MAGSCILFWAAMQVWLYAGTAAPFWWQVLLPPGLPEQNRETRLSHCKVIITFTCDYHI
jgi:hypothetical protein